MVDRANEGGTPDMLSHVFGKYSYTSEQIDHFRDHFAQLRAQAVDFVEAVSRLRLQKEAEEADRGALGA